MLSVSEIQKFYPQHLRNRKKFILREYLQYLILEIIYDSKYSRNLCFMGGTCLRIIHHNNRFSEDLDFDNLGLDTSEFSNLTEIITAKLESVGYSVEIKNVKKNAWHCHIKFPGLLYEENLSGHKEEKIIIQIDTEPQNYTYTAEKVLLNKFEVFTTIFSTPIDLLMAQKIHAILNRKRSMGRDFFDLVFLMSKNVKPDMEYLNAKDNLKYHTDAQFALLDKASKLDMKTIAADVEPFLFDSTDKDRVSQFEVAVRQYEFG